MKEIKVTIPEKLMNVGVTFDNKYLIGDTNDSENWNTFKYLLPEGKWHVSHYGRNCVYLISYYE